MDLAVAAVEMLATVGAADGGKAQPVVRPGAAPLLVEGVSWPLPRSMAWVAVAYAQRHRANAHPGSS